MCHITLSLCSSFLFYIVTIHFQTYNVSEGR
nr:MAG TPA: hypothetical protein [Caudoviricetes sp.]